MRWIKLSLVLLSVFVLAGCGSVSNTSSSTGKASQISIVGNYVLGLASCEKGQFDVTKASDYLVQNQRITEMLKENMKVRVQISSSELTTNAPAPFYGAYNKSCSITTVEKISYPSLDKLSRRLVSRACSTSCSTSDCKEEKLISESPISVFQLGFEQGSLYMADQASLGACSSPGATPRIRVLYSKE